MTQTVIFSMTGGWFKGSFNGKAISGQTIGRVHTVEKGGIYNIKLQMFVRAGDTDWARIFNNGHLIAEYRGQSTWLWFDPRNSALVSF